MWDLGSRNRSVFVLLSTLTVSILLYNAWGPLLLLVASIACVTYVIYSLLTNDSVLSPRAFCFLAYLQNTGQEIATSLYFAIVNLSDKTYELYAIVKRYYRDRLLPKMNRFRHNRYQLSDDDRETRPNASRSYGRYDLMTNQLSPIPRTNYQSRAYNATLANAARDSTRRLDDTYSGHKQTSTPLMAWNKGTVPPREDIGLFTPSRQAWQETQLTYRRPQPADKSDETMFRYEGSPWGTSISPKMATDASSRQTVQTVAGPLLASTRYNIDPKIYSDVTSPGLSSRLARYASEANNKLAHQPQYLMGQFPKVNLHAAPLPLISARNNKNRTPVTVRIAPPQEVARKDTRVTPSVLQVLKDISLKRHASREYISTDLAKKQKTEGVFDEDSLDELEEMTQKRTREDSPNTDEDSPSKSSVSRPLKKTKTPSCYDVINSLSSSNTFPSGVKRKASTQDLSRSGTPDVEKHLKLSNVAQTNTSMTLDASDSQKSQKIGHVAQSMDVSDPGKKVSELETARVKGILKQTPGTSPEQSLEKGTDTEEKIEEDKIESPDRAKPSNFTDKLFMKAEPKTNERLRTLIQEQSNIRAKFTTDDVDEIRKEDIVNMRQTSMRARLQSMFDAISGKAANKINPDIVIHAEGVSDSTPGVATPPNSTATLTSTTITTNVNTMPIATSAPAPVPTDPKLATPGSKHVRFNLPSYESSQGSVDSGSNVFTIASTTAATTQPAATAVTTTTSSIFASDSTLSSSQTTEVDASSSVGQLNPITGVFTSLASSSPQKNILATASSGLSKAVSTTNANEPSTTTSGSTITASSAPNTIVTNAIPVQNSLNFTSPMNKPSEIAGQKPSAAAVPNFSFGGSKTPVSTTFGTVGQAPSVATDKQAASAPSVPTSSVASSNATLTPSPAFGTNMGITSASSTPSFSFGSNNNNTAAIQRSSSAVPNFQTSSNADNKNPAITGTPLFGGPTTQNPPAFGSNKTQQRTTTDQNPPAYGTTATTTQSTPSFKSTATSAAPPVFGNATTSGSAISFGNSSTTSVAASSAFTANANPTTTSNASNPGFSFGSIKSPATTSGFTFGSNASTTASTAATSNPMPSFAGAGNSGFGSTTTTSPFGKTATPMASVFPTTSATAPPAFGSTTAPTAFGSTTTTAPPAFGNTTTTAPPAFGNTTTTAPPAFGNTTTTAPPAFGNTTTTTPPAFGSTTTTAPPAYGTQATPGTSLFGAPATTTSSGMFSSTSNQPTFGGIVSSTASTGFGVTTQKTTAPPVFGSSNAAPTFGGTTSTSSNLFGRSNAGVTSPTTQPAATPTFGDNAASKNIFGEVKAPGPFGATSPTFGGNAPSSAFGTQNAPTFGTSNPGSSVGNSQFAPPNVTAPIFGAQSGSKPTTAPPPFGATSSSFGTTVAPPPAFGANTTTTSGFGGSSTPGFGTQSAASPAFGATNTGNTANFGTNSTMLFGAQSPGSSSTFPAANNPPPAFGTTNTNPNHNSSFSFGGNQPPAQNSTFFFAGTSGAANSSQAAPFQFGNAAPKADSGFNFNAPSATPAMNFGANGQPSFGAPAPGTNMFGTGSPAVPAGGMFSIGAGSSAPRSRTTRTRRQR